MARGYFGEIETWKIVYLPKNFHGGMRGVALIEADSRHQAIHTFSEQYAGEYVTVESCSRLLG